MKKNNKNEGSGMLVAVFLSGLILTMGLAGSRLLLKEVKMSAELWNSEQAYFSAEGGIEQALLFLEKNPVEFVEHEAIALVSDSDVSRIKVDLSIKNQVSEFDFVLRPYENQKFRMLSDTDDSLSSSNQIFTALEMNVEEQPDKNNILVGGNLKYIWKILCRNTSENTVSIEKIEENKNHIPNILTANGGSYESVDGSEINFGNLSDVNSDSCFFSVQSLVGDKDLKFTFYASVSDKITPNASKIIAVGSRNKQEKRLVFEYKQKNLGSLFDFTFLHTD